MTCIQGQNSLPLSPYLGLLLPQVYRAITLLFFHLIGNGIISFKEFVMATDMTTAGTPEEKLKVGLHCQFEQFVIVVSLLG